MSVNHSSTNNNLSHRSNKSVSTESTKPSYSPNMTSYQHMIAHFTARAKNPNLSYPCFLFNEHLAPSVTLSDLDKCFYSGNIRMEFIAENIITGQKTKLMFSQSFDKDKKSICYALDGKPIIIKPASARYKTLKGCISGLYSATFEGDLLSVDEDSVLLSSFVVGTSSPCYEAYLSSFAD